MWGRTGGIREDRAALLAANGFAALAIAYSGLKDLPGSSYCMLQVSYFERAIDWLTAHSKVKPDGVGLVGLSLGGVLGLGIASQLQNKIKAVVSISGSHILLGCSLKSEAMTIPGYPINLKSEDYASYSQMVSGYKSKEVCKPGSPWMIPVEHITCPVLLVYGLADKLNPTIEWMCGELFRRMEQHGKGSLCRRLGLPGAGHVLVPCYIPPYSKQYAKTFNEMWFLGGDDKALSAKASEKYWNESLEFLLKYI